MNKSVLIFSLSSPTTIIVMHLNPVLTNAGISFYIAYCTAFLLACFYVTVMLCCFYMILFVIMCFLLLCNACHCLPSSEEWCTDGKTKNIMKCTVKVISKAKWCCILRHRWCELNFKHTGVKWRCVQIKKHYHLFWAFKWANVFLKVFNPLFYSTMDFTSCIHSPSLSQQQLFVIL